MDAAGAASPGGPPAFADGPRVADSVLRAYLRARPGLADVRFVPGPTVLARPGDSLLRIAEANQVALETGCRLGLCGADPVRVVAGAEHLSPPSTVERATLRRLALPAGCRMACAARVRGPVTVARVDEDTPHDAAEAADSPTAARHALDSGRRVVVIGNGVAGVTAAIELREHDADVDITVLGAEPHDFHNRMVINKLVAGSTAVGRLTLLPADWAESRRIRHLRGVAARSIDRRRSEVQTEGGDALPYDRLLLAMGAGSDVAAVEHHGEAGIFAMRTIGDALEVAQYIRERRCRRAVVVGGGLLGLEAAFSIGQAGVRVAVVETAPWPLARQLDRPAGALVLELMADLGVKIHAGTAARALHGGDRVEEVELADGRRLACDLALLAAGIRPNAGLARRAGLAVDRGVIVDARMATSDPRIFAAGDVGSSGGQTLGLWTAAMEQARVAAINMLGGDCRYEPRVPPTWLKVPGLDVLSVGDVTSDADALEIAVDDGDPRQYRKLVLRAGKASAAILVGHQALQEAVCSAVQARRDLRDTVDALRRGDWTVLAPAA